MTPANNKIETSMNLTTHQHTHLHTHSRMRELSRGWLGKPTNLILSSYKSGGNKAEQSTCVGQAGKDHRQQSLVEKDFIPALLHSCHSFVPLWVLVFIVYVWLAYMCVFDTTLSMASALTGGWQQTVRVWRWRACLSWFICSAASLQGCIRFLLLCVLVPLHACCSFLFGRSLSWCDETFS